MVDIDEKKAIKKASEIADIQKNAAEDTIKTNEFVIKEWKKSSGSMISIQQDYKKTLEQQSQVSQQYKKFVKKDEQQNTSFIKEFLKSSKIAQSIQSQASASMSAISGHINEVLGPLQEASDFTKKTFSNIGGFFKGIGQDLGLFLGEGDVDEKQLKESEEQTTLLQKILGIFKGEKKEKFKESLTKKKKPLGIFGAIAMALGMAIGAVVGAIVLPFTLLLKIPGIRKLRGLIKPLRKFFIRILWIFRNTKILGPLLKGIRLGFRVLTKPLAILLALIDFVRGFVATEGSLLDKIKGGLTVAIMKFLELPIRLFGFILDKILSVFGVEIEGGTTGYIVSIIKGTIGFIFDLVSSIFQGIYDMIKIFPWDAVKSVIQKVADVFLWPFKKLWDWIKDSKIIKYLASKFAGMDVSKEDPFAVKSLTKGVKADQFDLTKLAAVSEVGSASDGLSRSQFDAIQRVKERMKTMDEGQKTFMEKMIKKIAEGQVDAAKIMIATATNKEGESKEPVALAEDFGVVMEALV